MVTLIGLSGSLRRGSFNTALLRAAIDLVPDGHQMSLYTPRGIPPYDGDVEKDEGLPKVVVELKDALAAASGLLIATPEYNNSMPGVLKNAIDWLSRPPADITRVFGGRPVAVMGASTGRFGTVLGQHALVPVLRALGMRPWFEGRLFVPRAQEVFDASGRLVDEKVREQLERFVSGFVRFADSR